MSKLQSFVFEDHTEVFVEVDEFQAPEGFVPVGAGDGEGDREFSKALARVKPAAENLVAMLNGLVRPPDEYEVEFGIKFSVGVGALIAKTSTDANFRIKLKWAPKTQ